MKAIKILFMPITWAVGFLFPLFAQSLLAVGFTDSTMTAYVVGAVLALGWGVMAQLRGSWMWVR